MEQKILNIALIAPPWQLFYRPSVQLAVLKAFVCKQRAEYRIKNLHPYLFVAESVGSDVYNRISQSAWASEAVCAALLFPEMRERILELIASSLKRRGGAGIDLHEADKVISLTGWSLRSYLRRLPFDTLHLVGITACLNQFTSTLFIASEIKRIRPDLPVLAGGAGFSGGAGSSVLSTCNWIDYVIEGEGELPFLWLCDYISGRSEALPHGIVGRSGDLTEDSKCALVQIEDMDTLPVPDYDDFFREKAMLSSLKFRAELCVEASRGCWWNRCSFCNLNIQWKGYREKSVEKIAGEVAALADRYGCIDFAFMDNALPRRNAVNIFHKLSEHGRDYRFFAELRTGNSRDEMKNMAAGGLKELQVGIEALSQSLLKRMNKGTNVIDNVAAMRHAAEAGINLQGNLILHFPGSTEQEAEETLRALEWLWPFSPLKSVSFWLGSGSPVAEHPENFDICCIVPDHRYRKIFPSSFIAGLSPLILSYRSDRLRQQRIWKGVRQRLREWERNRKRLGTKGHLLSYRDGGNFLMIEQILPDGKVLTHRLSGHSRRLYLAATDIRRIGELVGKGFDEAQVRHFFSDLAEKRLVFVDGEKVLSLALHA